jgi:hypothetical protein
MMQKEWNGSTSGRTDVVRTPSVRQCFGPAHAHSFTTFIAGSFGLFALLAGTVNDIRSSVNNHSVVKETLGLVPSFLCPPSKSFFQRPPPLSLSLSLSLSFSLASAIIAIDPGLGRRFFLMLIKRRRSKIKPNPFKFPLTLQFDPYTKGEKKRSIVNSLITDDSAFD